MSGAESRKPERRATVTDDELKAHVGRVVNGAVRDFETRLSDRLRCLRDHVDRTVSHNATAGGTRDGVDRLQDHLNRVSRHQRAQTAVLLVALALAVFGVLS